MNYSERALLPEGFRDDLPPFAEHEAGVLRGLLDHFASFGYDRVSPPFAEFETSLLAGVGEKKSRELFRLMDPLSQRMMALRADMTPQVERIAITRLRHLPRPLRISYAGPVLRVKGSQLRPSRQFFQAGVELIGGDAPAADREVILLAVQALSAAGIPDLSVDLTYSSLVPMITAALGLDTEMADAVRDALNAKDIGALDTLDGRGADLFRGLLAAAGPANACLERLKALPLPAAAVGPLAELSAIVADLEAAAPDLHVTIDPGEYHGFEYKSGVGFALFSRHARGELGRGGRYVVHHADGATETATGFTVYLDTLMRAIPAPAAPEKLYLPFGASAADATRLRGQGRRVVAGLSQETDAVAEAKRLGCSHIWKGDAAVSLLSE